MLLDFSFQNYRSFQGACTLSLLPEVGLGKDAASYGGKHRALSAALVFGANASGKSNLLRAVRALRSAVLHSAEHLPDAVFAEYEPFRFRATDSGTPVAFAAHFLHEGTRYRYALALGERAVQREELLFYPQGREARLFSREGEHYAFGEYLKGQKAVVAGLTAPNQLFLSKAALNNMEQLTSVYRFFAQQLMPVPLLDARTDRQYLNRIARELQEQLTEPTFARRFRALLRSFDTGVTDVHITRTDDGYEVAFAHPVFDDKGKPSGGHYLPFEEESEGTQKLFVLGALVLRALLHGRTLLIDELERSLHPHITGHLIGLFQNPAINTRGAQLIAATHDTSLLGQARLRRDQVWFVEKDRQGASTLFSLADVQGVRADTPLEKWYLSGRFGSVPVPENLNVELSFAHATE